MTANTKIKKKEEKAIQANKSQHANYKWIKHMFARQDELAIRLENLERTVKFISDELQKIDEDMRKNAKK